MPRTSKAIAEIDARYASCEAEAANLNAKLDAALQRLAMLGELKLALTPKSKAKPARPTHVKTPATPSTAS